MWLHTIRDAFKCPGMSIAVIIGEETWTSSVGTKLMDGTDPVDENTMYAIASNSKAFTATCLG